MNINDGKRTHLATQVAEEQAAGFPKAYLRTEVFSDKLVQSQILNASSTVREGEKRGVRLSGVQVWKIRRKKSLACHGEKRGVRKSYIHLTTRFFFLEG